MGVTISTKGLKKLATETIAGLAGPMKDNTDEQFVILRVVPVEDTRVRGVPSTTTTVEVVGIEAAMNADHRRAVRLMMQELTLERKRLSPQGDQQELPLDEVPGDGVGGPYDDL